MTPPLPPERRATGDYSPTKPVRAARSYPPVPEPRAIDGAPPWVRALQGQMAEMEGRFYAETADLERRVRVRVETDELADLSAKLTIVGRHSNWWRRATIAFGGVAGVAFASCVTRLVASTELTEAAKEVAADTAETKAAELTSRHEETRQIAEDAGRRVDQLEIKLDQVLELLTRPTPVIVPPAEPAPKRGHR